ncbi:helix-turn-helix domain-containing protein [Candidatus Omnitrophota bacterium]
MIKNDRQLQYTIKQLRNMEEALKDVRDKYSSNKNQVEVLSQGYIEHIKQMKAEITEYKRMKTTPLPAVLRAKNPTELSHILVRLRLFRGFTQEQLASLVKCNQSDISRLEREDYKGYTVKQLEKIARILNADVELNLIPAKKKQVHKRKKQKAKGER